MRRLVTVYGKEIRICGRFLRIAQLEGDGYEFLADPDTMIDALRRSSVSIDLFTFLQKLPDTSPKYSYPMEWDNLAVVPVSTFEHWWTRQIRPEARNGPGRRKRRGLSSGRCLSTTF